MGLKTIEVKRQNVEVRVLEDKWLYDTETIDDADSEQEFFVTKQNKARFLARFAGDESLVREGNFFEWMAVEHRILANSAAAAEVRPTDDDLVLIAHEGFVEAKISDETVLEENSVRLFGGFDFLPVLGTIGLVAAAADSFMGSGQHGNVRKFAVSKIVPGGRTFEYTVFWAGAGGVGGVVNLAESRRLQIALYGIESIPTGKVRRSA